MAAADRGERPVATPRCGKMHGMSNSSTSPRGLFDLRHRIALVTGSSRGIGLALARALAEAGATIVLNGRNPGALQDAQSVLTSEGHTVHVSAFDVCDQAAVDRAIALIEGEIGGIEILVNNAGIQKRAAFLDYPVEDFRELIEVNLVSAFVVGKAVASRMASRGHGKIINICSVQSQLGRPTIAPYAATKGGLKLLTQGMCADLGPLGIQVNALAPGYISTELTAALVADAEFSAWVARRTPAGRWGSVEELAGGIVFLAASASDFVNGQILYIDGGMTAVV